MKKLFSLLSLSIISLTMLADEGMWLPSLISQRIPDMQAKGFKLQAEDIYSVNQACLKDAIVLFGGGCTGELISPKGLLLTNHHCGYGQIQRHSSVEHDYLKDGFWAMTMKEELPNEGLTVSFLDRMDDVTDIVLRGYQKWMSESQRDSIVKANSKELINLTVGDKKGLRASVEPLFYGNQYFMFIFRVFSDVRLVGAPPSSIGKFGGDTDNWMWPRHTGDFSIFRIYADRDNNPAPYSESNIPYTPKKFFKISTKGVQNGDFTFVYGFPGSTKEYITSKEVQYISQRSNPDKILLRTHRLDAQKKYMSKDQAVRIQYSSKNAGVSNAWKKWQGEMKGIDKMGTVYTKMAYEKRFREWAKGNEYAEALDRIDLMNDLLEDYAYATDYYNEAIRPIELTSFALRISSLVSQGQDIANAVESFYKDYYLPIDKMTFISLIKEYDKKLEPRFKPAYFTEQMAKHGTVEKWADYLFSNSLFIDRRNLELFKDKDSESVAQTIKNDPATQFGKAFAQYYEEEINPKAGYFRNEIGILYRTYMKGQMLFEPDKIYYPDANLTLRVAYGKVAGYWPTDAVIYTPISTIEGIMQKDNPEIFDYDIPQKLRDLYAAKDYGRWAVNGTIPVCFLATNHTTGGNSGSPVLNSEGHLVGINFDRVWEGTMSDIVYDPLVCRNISLDIRYVLFIIDKLAGARHLIEEMELIQ